MSTTLKVDEYAFRRVPKDVRDFADQATLIFNYGKYSAQVVTTPPQWIARNGEFVFFQSSTSSGNRVYFYANDQWNWMAGSPSGGGGSPGGPETAIQSNYPLGTFYGDSGFTYRANSAVGIARDMLMAFNIDNSSNTYMMQSLSSGYLEFFLDGAVRLQM